MDRRLTSKWTFTVLLLLSSFITSLGNLSHADDAEKEYSFATILHSGPVRSPMLGRSAVTTDPIIGGLVTGELQPPQEGDPSGTGFRGTEHSWKSLSLGDDGAIEGEGLRGGYLYLTYEADAEEIVIVKPNGFSEVLINGVPRIADMYGKNWVMHPVKLHKGQNEFWCRLGRGRNKGLKLQAPEKPIYLTDVDATLPDFLTHESSDKWAAVRVMNATEATLDGLSIRAGEGDDSRTTEIAGSITPLTSRKLAFKVHDSADSPGEQVVQVELLQHGEVVDTAELQFAVKELPKNYRKTFVSKIDGSVQFYGVREGTSPSETKPAMFLSVHGAGVNALGQAGSYKAKDWGHVVAPTNRREFGFDWEDWGRLDAMEVLADAEERFGTDPERTFLTGHSMGGHGTWYLGATYPGRWAAISPNAGWQSFFSYGRRFRGNQEEQPDPIKQMMDRAANTSRTLEMVRNYRPMGVYVAHGDNDRTVPVAEAREMREHLAKFHPDFAYFEEPGGGHWYGVDHPYIFDYFKWHTRQDVRDLETLEFRVPSPGISHKCFYITLYQQEQPYDFCGVVSKQTIRSRRQRRHDEDISEREFDISTENLHCFAVDLSHCKGFEKVSIKVDDQLIESLPWPESEEVWLEKNEGTWKFVERPQRPEEKNPVRYGGFKDAFRHRMVFVYGTQGDEAENTWSYNKARFDAETFYYRGNGSIDVVPDSEFSLEAYQDRSVIIYGNATTNGAWQALLEDSPVQVRRGEIQFADRLLTGDDLGIYMVRPRSDSDVASVGVVAGTGIPGCRSVNPNRYFVAGTGFPDLMILTPSMYTDGYDGLTVAGYFGNDWSVENGSFVWSEDSNEDKDTESAETVSLKQ